MQTFANIEAALAGRLNAFAAPGAHQPQDRVHHLFADRQMADDVLGADQRLRRPDRARHGFLAESGGDEHALFRLEIGIADIARKSRPVERLADMAYNVALQIAAQMGGGGGHDIHGKASFLGQRPCSFTTAYWKKLSRLLS